MRILITGARGMVGSALVRRLPPEHDIVALSRADVDLLEVDAVRRTMRDVAPDLVVHAAGMVGGIEANRRANSRFLIVNTTMGFNVVQAAHEAGVTRLLHLSSSCVYPRDRELLRESDMLTGALEPTNQGYALAKISVMYLCQALSAEDADRRYKTFVPCNLYGPGDSYDDDRSHLVPSAIKKVHAAVTGHAEQVAIWGDGTVRREFMYVDDLVDAVARAAADWDGTPDVLNLGLGHDHTVDSYYQAVAAVLGYHGGFVHEVDRPVGMRRKLLDVSRAREWGWVAATPLEAGLRATVADYLARR